MKPALAFGALILWGAPVAAQSWTTATEETEAFCLYADNRLPPNEARQFCTVLRSDRAQPDATLRLADQALAAIDEPSEFNAILLTVRGTLLAELGFDATAVKVFEQAVARYPDFPEVKLSAISALAYSGAARRAADYWIGLIETNPSAAHMLPVEALTETVDRLRQQGDQESAGSLIRALYASGFDGTDPWSRSTFGLLALDNAVASRNLDEARMVLREGRITNPELLNSIASFDFYRPLWSEVGWLTAEERQAAVRDWIVSIGYLAMVDPSRSGDFISATLPHVGPDAIIAAYEEDLLKGLDSDGANLHTYAFWLGPLANAHVLRGDVVSAERIYRTAIHAMRGSDDITRFNADANYGRFLVDIGRHADALSVIEPAIAGLAQMDAANPALAPMHGVRARALHGLGRLNDSDPSLAAIRGALDGNFTLVMNTLLQLDRSEEARDLLLGSLVSLGNSRPGMAYLQHSIEGYPLPAAIQRQRMTDILRADPDVIAALAQRGRIVPQDAVVLDGITLPKFTFSR